MNGTRKRHVPLAPKPSDAIDPAPRWIPRPVPTWWQLLRSEATRRVRSPLDLISGSFSAFAAPAVPRSSATTSL